MAYASQTHIELAVGGATRLRELADWDDDGEVDAGVIAEAQAAADGYIDSYARTRYATPIETPSATLIRVAAEEAVYWMRSKRGVVGEEHRKEGLIAIEKRARQLGPAFAELKAPMKADQRDHAKARSGPDAKWARRAPSTITRRGNGKRLLKTLPTRTVKVTSGPGEVAAASKVPWSGVHNEGGTVGNGAVMPERRFLWLSAKLMDTAEHIFASHVLGVW